MQNKIFTQAGLDKLKKELTELKEIRRPATADRIKSAKEYGDLSENAEYHEAKEEQSFIEGRILELEKMINTAIVVDSKSNSDVVTVGSRVSVDKAGQSLEFTIVGSTEADPVNKKISLESPLGQALMDHKVGEEVEVDLPSAQVKYRIIKIK